MLAFASLALATLSAPAVPTQSFDALFAPPALLSLEGRCALVTGASGGIGRATACALAREGMDLVLIARRKERLLELKAEIERRELPSSVLIFVGDVSDDALYAELRASGCLERVDTLINNAGLARGVEQVGKASAKDWKEMLDANCYGAFRIVNEVGAATSAARAPLATAGTSPSHVLVRAVPEWPPSRVGRTRAAAPAPPPPPASRRARAQVLPHMLARGCGHVVSLGSIAGLEPYEGGSVYCASKSALHAFCKSLRYETYDQGVRATVVAPGLVREILSLAAPLAAPLARRPPCRWVRAQSFPRCGCATARGRARCTTESPRSRRPTSRTRSSGRCASHSTSTSTSYT
jgi:NADP-dependent 3-hydroxy acid dehydrogenase YdfG